MTTENQPETRPVPRALYRPLTVCGIDRRLFFLALLVGAATFNLFYSFLAGCLLFTVLYAVGWWSTSHDPQLLQILLRSGGVRRRYDAAQYADSNRGSRQEHKRETFVAQLTFALKDQVPNAMVLVNPLGLTITYFRVDQAFQ